MDTHLLRSIRITMQPYKNAATSLPGSFCCTNILSPATTLPPLAGLVTLDPAGPPSSSHKSNPNPDFASGWSNSTTPTGYKNRTSASHYNYHYFDEMPVEARANHTHTTLAYDAVFPLSSLNDWEKATCKEQAWCERGLPTLRSEFRGGINSNLMVIYGASALICSLLQVDALSIDCGGGQGAHRGKRKRKYARISSAVVGAKY